MIYYIYILQNDLNKKIYVGQTDNIDRRKREHRAADRYFTKKTPIYHAIRKYGFENFTMFVLGEFDNTEDVDWAEIYWIKYFNSRDRKFGYNLAEGGRVNRGNKWTDKAKQKQSKRKKEYFKTHRPWNFGVPHSQETKDKLSQSYKGEKALTAKFTNQQIFDIRQQFLTTQFSINELAKIHKVSATTMSGIVLNKTYIDINYNLTKEFLEKMEQISISKGTNHSKNPIKDDKGNIFDSINAAAKFYDTPYNVISYYIFYFITSFYKICSITFSLTKWTNIRNKTIIKLFGFHIKYLN